MKVTKLFISMIIFFISMCVAHAESCTEVAAVKLKYFTNPERLELCRYATNSAPVDCYLKDIFFRNKKIPGILKQSKIKLCTYAKSTAPVACIENLIAVKEAERAAGKLTGSALGSFFSDDMISLCQGAKKDLEKEPLNCISLLKKFYEDDCFVPEKLLGQDILINKELMLALCGGVGSALKSVNCFANEWNKQSYPNGFSQVYDQIAKNCRQ